MKKPFHFCIARECEYEILFFVRTESTEDRRYLDSIGVFCDDRVLSIGVSAISDPGLLHRARCGHHSL